jgi:hypothetical protein
MAVHTEAVGQTTFAIVAEYETSDALVRATNKAYDAGYRQMDAYAPFPVHGLPEALGFEDPRLQYLIFFGGLSGCLGGFGLLWWICASAYPHNVGGRPLFSWPAFIPVTFECTILLAALTAVFGMLALNKLPEPHHPIFDTPNFERASQDAFFLSVEAVDPKFIEEDVRALLEDTGAVKVSLIKQEEPEW